MVRLAWDIDPRLAVQMPNRFKLAVVENELRNLVINNTLDVVNDPEALVILLGERLTPTKRLDLKVGTFQHGIALRNSIKWDFHLAFAILESCSSYHRC
jgi:hypothetical protein